MTDTERNKSVVSDLIDRVFSRGDARAADEHLADGFVFHDPPFGLTPDKAGMLAAADIVRSACPDWRSEIRHLVAEGDLVVEHFVATGTHTGAPLMGVLAVAGVAPQPVDGIRPGIVVVGADLVVTSANREAEQWLDALEAGSRDGADLPAPLAAAVVRVIETDDPVTVRLRSRGGWTTVHASPLQGAEPQVALVLDSPTDGELSSLVLASLGLTPAQTRVAALVLQGRSTREITAELRISSHTVQEHLRVAFDKVGVGSRRELVAALTGRSGGHG